MFSFTFPAAWLLAAIAVAQLLWALRRVRGTTLVAPLGWAVAAVGMLTVSATYGHPDSPADRYLAYTAALFALAPGLAVLGAKRPQHAAWQFIVLSFVGILLLPALNGWAGGLAAPQPHALFRWLNLAVFLVGAGNYLATAQCIPAATAAVGVGLLLRPWLPFGTERDWTTDFWALVWVNFGLMFGRIVADRRRAAPRGMNRAWIDFRDAYGAVWGVRVAERLNVAARRHGWPITLTWRGARIADTGDEADRSDGPVSQPQPDPATAQGEPSTDPAVPVRHLTPELERRIRREFYALLRRFVSPGWIAARDAVEPTSPRAGGPGESSRAGRGVSSGGEHTE
jgi:hypothetical protein